MTRAQEGFTLIEVLVALVLMAVVSLVSWRGLDSVVRIGEHVERDAQRDAAILRVLGQIERDVQMRAPDYVLLGSAGGTSARPTLLPAALDVQASPQTGLLLDIVRAPTAQAGGWQRIRWWLEAGTLRRAIADAGDRFPLPLPGPGATVLNDVTGFDIRVYVPGQGWTAVTRDPGNQPASGLEFVLDLAAASDSTPRYRRVVALP